MKGIILAGGTGSRLGKLTSVLNKHLVAVGEVPMIEFPLATLKRIKVEDITIVTGAEHVGTVVQYLTKEHPDIDFTYKVQKKAGGIAQALALTESSCKNSNLAVILGDNIFEENFSREAYEFNKNQIGAMLFLKQVGIQDAKRFGIAVVRGDKVKYVEEKPENPMSNLAMTGLYFFDSKVFDYIRLLQPSARGELEITDAIRLYAENNELYHTSVKGFWSDAGTHESRRKAEEYLYLKGMEHFLSIRIPLVCDK